MIKLVFSFDRELMNFLVKDREIYYTDRKFGNWVRCVPEPDNFIKMVSHSRNRIPMYIANIFKLTPEEKEEYDAVKTEDELADIIIRDAKSKGCIFINRFNEISVEDNKRGVII